MKCAAFVVNNGNAVLLNFSVDSREKLIPNEHSLVGLFSFEYEDGGCCVQELRKWGLVRQEFMGLTSELAAGENGIALTTGSGCTDEKMKKLHNVMKSVLDGLLQCQQEGPEENTSSDLC